MHNVWALGGGSCFCFQVQLPKLSPSSLLTQLEEHTHTHRWRLFGFTLITSVVFRVAAKCTSHVAVETSTSPSTRNFGIYGQ